jgi:hypothetical protein
MLTHDVAASLRQRLGHVDLGECVLIAPVQTADGTPDYHVITRPGLDPTVTMATVIKTAHRIQCPDGCDTCRAA